MVTTHASGWISTIKCYEMIKFPFLGAFKTHPNNSIKNTRGRNMENSYLQLQKNNCMIEEKETNVRNNEEDK